MLNSLRMATLFTVCAALFACSAITPSAGGGAKTDLTAGARVPNPADIALPAGYRAEVVVSGLTFPTGVTFDEKGTPYLVESGYSYGEVWTVPRLLRVEKGTVEVVAQGGKNGPWTGVTRHAGAFYVAEGGELEGGKILRVSDDGTMKSIIDNLPTRGDHHTNGPVVGPDGFLYFGLGTATNSGIVGEDNYRFGWLKRDPKFHDTACRDIVLAGENYRSPDVVKGDGEVETGAFVPFGTKTKVREIIKGRVPCNGAVLKVAINGGAPELVAWGFRNPFGLAFSPAGTLFVTDNGFDTRGSRPVFGGGDALWEVQQGTWYGWPDFSAGVPVDEGDQFKAMMQPRPKLLLAHYPNRPPAPAAVLPVHASADGFDFSRSDGFGHRGECFIALFGDQSPATGKLRAPVGFKVVRVDVNSGVVHDFAVNKGKENAPASALRAGGLERPVAARFDPSGQALYVVDFGALKETTQGTIPLQKTGVLWRITREQ